METVIDKLTKNNEFPVVFIGSGISKRFLNDFPDWTTLLKEFWEKAGLENFYGEFNNIRDKLKGENPHYTEKELDHYSNIKVGSFLEVQFNKAFNSGLIELQDFTPEMAFKFKISPFKKALADRFRTYSLKESVEEEYTSFKKMLAKTQIILTTNYDYFIEDSYNQSSTHKLDRYIGQKGFFKETYGYAELYKLHGCCSSPMDIKITEDDYKSFDENSVLISAKIISMMMNSPIIFMGYSLTDINVRKIIKDFTKSLTDKEIEFLEERLILIDWKEGEDGFDEQIENDRDLGCKLKVIRTDNYKLIFEKISRIDQGIAPTEVRKYQHVIKKLIIDRGKKGTLNTVLLSPEELDKLEEHIQTKNITVAIGDAKYIFQIPDIITYCLDYISDKDEISTEIMMRFSTYQNGRIPIHKLKKDQIDASSLHASEKDKLKNKLTSFSSLSVQQKSIVEFSVFDKDTDDARAIIARSDQKKSKIYETLSYNIKRLDLNVVKDFLVEELTKMKEIGEIKIPTELRRLMLIYDIIKNKGGNG